MAEEGRAPTEQSLILHGEGGRSAWDWLDGRTTKRDEQRGKLSRPADRSGHRGAQWQWTVLASVALLHTAALTLLSRPSAAPTRSAPLAILRTANGRFCAVSWWRGVRFQAPRGHSALFHHSAAS